ncbi:MAG: hypothetical protein U1C18_00900, partial [Patescibacteria group bacterium]|nr:hypothetical protein [Patescibacteria group bacterium]
CDINRQFVKESDDTEAQTVMALLKGRAFDACISFHEDPQLSEFYMYDTAELLDDELAALRQGVVACGVGLFSGVDDPEDEFLGFDFVDGYRPHTGGDGEPKGPLETWLIREGISKRVFGVEVPGKIAPNKKDAVVKRVFECLC